MSPLKRDDARRLNIYSVGDLVTVERGEELVRSRLRMDDEGDLYLPGCGFLTNSQIRDGIGAIIDGEGWNITACVRGVPS